MKERIIELGKNDNYEAIIREHFRNSVEPTHLVLKDPYGVLPDYADNWNGVTVIRKENTGSIEEHKNEQKNENPEIPIFSMNRIQYAESFFGGFSNIKATGRLPYPLPSPLKLNLGCGLDIKDGYINIDLCTWLLYLQGEESLNCDILLAS